jgi:hypothetical protein
VPDITQLIFAPKIAVSNNNTNKFCTKSGHFPIVTTASFVPKKFGQATFNQKRTIFNNNAKYLLYQKNPRHIPVITKLPTTITATQGGTLKSVGVYPEELPFTTHNYTWPSHVPQEQ